MTIILLSNLSDIIISGDIDALKSFPERYGEAGIMYLNRRRLIDSDCNMAAKHGKLAMLQYLHNNGFNWSTTTPKIAASYGHLDCLKYLHEHGCPWDHQTCRGAVCYKQIECLRYAHKNGCSIQNCGLMEIPTSLACLQYLHENGCPWSYMTCQIYALRHKLECLAYAHEHGAPWDEDTFIPIRGFCKYGEKAIREKYNDVLQYMRDHGCPGSTLTDTELTKELTDANGVDL